jgi:hypothetical protein
MSHDFWFFLRRSETPSGGIVERMPRAILSWIRLGIWIASIRDFQRNIHMLLDFQV